jgi:CTD nuclear envelope phosphatase 1
MNSLSIISSTVDKVIGNTSPVTPGEESFRGLRRTYRSSDFHSGATNRIEQDDPLSLDGSRIQDDLPGNSAVTDGEGESEDEARTPRAGDRPRAPLSVTHRVYLVFVDPWLGALRWIISAVTASAKWIESLLYTDDGIFYPQLPFRRAVGVRRGSLGAKQSRIQPSAITTSDVDDGPQEVRSTGSAVDRRRSRSFSGDMQNSTEDISPRRSIRIRLYNEERVHQGRSPSVKSPTSPQAIHRITKYPKSAGPPIPLLPRHPSPKTLILDLDETLIHSLAKGGRMSSGHMVEVKLDRQHAILYYVHKRPYCDEFLRKVHRAPGRYEDCLTESQVCRWYNLVIFTASVQEYADPVIDWLEQDRKYFSGRYYRQHCTNRNGAYIKDIATVEPDLSRVMIIDNSPTSYIFHEGA